MRGRMFSLMVVIAIIGCFIGSPAAAAQAGPKNEDRSLPDSDYVAMGMPAFDREWIGDDFLTAARVLDSLATRDASNLPRYRSANSGAMFDRIVSTRNLAFFSDKSISVNRRMVAAIKTGSAYSHIANTYQTAVDAKKIGSGNLIELMGANLRLMKALEQLADEFEATLPANDPLRANRQAGRARMREGLALIVTATLTTLTEEKNYSAAARARLAGYCRETFPVLVSRLTTPAQIEVLNRLERLQNTPEVQPFQPAIARLRDEVRRATALSSTSENE